MAKKTGTNHDDILRGTSGADLLLGRGGDDTLLGSSGNDTLDGGNGDDELLGGTGNDLLLPGKGGVDAMDGGAGTDTVSYANFNTTLGVDLILSSPSSVGGDDAAGDTFANVEIFIGSKATDIMQFGSNLGVHVVFGGDGDDIIYVPGGVARGDKGTDTIYLDSGRTLVDTFWLQLNKGQDLIQNFTAGQDKLRVTGKEFGIGALLGSDELFNRAADANPTGTKAQFIFRQDVDDLYFDPDGTGESPAVLLLDFDGTSPIGALQLHDFEVV